MARRVFFSFHYQNDIWRVNQVRSIPNITGCAAAGFQDASMWEEAKRNDRVVKTLIDRALDNTSVTIVCIGSQSAGRRYIDYEIDRSAERGNGLLGLQIHHLRDRNGTIDAMGITPRKLNDLRCPIYRYTDHTSLAMWIEQAARAAGK